MSDNPYIASEKLSANKEPFVLQWRHVVGAFFVLIGAGVLLMATMLISSIAVESIRDISPISYEKLFAVGSWLVIGLLWVVSGTAIAEARYRLGAYTASAAAMQTAFWIAIMV